MGDNEGGRSKPDDVASTLNPVPTLPASEHEPAVDAPETIAAGEPAPGEADGITSDLSADRLSGRQASGGESRDTSPGVAAYDAPARPSLRALWGALVITALVLLGAILYLFSTMPDAERIAGAEKAIADLRSQVAALQSKPAAGDTSALSQRIDASDRQLATLKADVSALQTRPTAPAQAVQGADAGETAAQIAAITAKVAETERTLGDLRTADENLKKQADGLGQQVSTLATKVDSLPKIDLGPLEARLDGLDARLKPIEDEFKAAKSPDRVTEARQNGSAAETRAAPLAVTSDAVLRAIDAGQPFAQYVKVLASLGADPGALQPLRAVADTGAPTTKDLRADLAALRDQVSAQSAPTPTGSYLDRLMSGAATMVRVRPLGSVVGDTPPAILARMDDDLARDDLAAALGEWQKLPESTRALGKGLAERIRLRQAAQDSARAIGASAIQAMVSDQR